MRTVKKKRSHGDIYVYLELCKQKRRAKQRNDELEFSRVPYSDPKQKRASARDGNCSGGWGGVGRGWGVGTCHNNNR